MINSQNMTVAGQIMVMAIILSIVFLFVGIGMLIFVHVCVVWRALRRGFGDVTHVVMERSGSNASMNGSISMSKDDLEKLPCFDYITKDTAAAASPVPDCAVCLESFQVGDKCRLLPICNHSFHAECVDVWLLQAPFCPMCRTSADSSKLGSGDVSLDMMIMRGGISQTTASLNGQNLSDVRIEVVGESQGINSTSNGS